MGFKPSTYWSDEKEEINLIFQKWRNFTLLRNFFATNGSQFAAKLSRFFCPNLFRRDCFGGSMMNGRLDLPTDSDQLSFLLRCSSEAGLLLRLIFFNFFGEKRNFSAFFGKPWNRGSRKNNKSAIFHTKLFFLKKINWMQKLWSSLGVQAKLCYLTFFLVEHFPNGYLRCNSELW